MENWKEHFEVKHAIVKNIVPSASNFVKALFIYKDISSFLELNKKASSLFSLIGE